MNKTARYVQGSMTTAPIYPDIKLGVKAPVLNKEQRKAINRAIALLKDVSETTGHEHALYNLSEVFRTVRSIGQELGQK